MKVRTKSAYGAIAFGALGLISATNAFAVAAAKMCVGAWREGSAGQVVTLSVNCPTQGVAPECNCGSTTEEQLPGHFAFFTACKTVGAPISEGFSAQTWTAKTIGTPQSGSTLSGWNELKCQLKNVPASGSGGSGGSSGGNP